WAAGAVRICGTMMAWTRSSTAHAWQTRPTELIDISVPFRRRFRCPRGVGRTAIVWSRPIAQAFTQGLHSAGPLSADSGENWGSNRAAQPALRAARQDG